MNSFANVGDYRQQRSAVCPKHPASSSGKMGLSRTRRAGESGMLLKTILNLIEKHAGFVYERITIVAQGARYLIEVEVRARRGSRPVCSGCSRRCSGYDTLQARRFQYVPLWGLPVFFVYAMRPAPPPAGPPMTRSPSSSPSAWPSRTSPRPPPSTTGPGPPPGAPGSTSS